MSNKILVVIETENGFIQQFEQALYSEAMTEYTINWIIPKFTKGPKPMMENCMNDIDKLSTDQIVAFFVDLNIEPGTLDNKGINIGMKIRNKFPETPVFCITAKDKYEYNFDNMSEATLEDFDGVFEKTFLTGDDFSEKRFDLILAKAAEKRNRNKRVQNKPNANRHSDVDPIKCDVAIVTALFEDEFEQVQEFVEIDETLSRKAGSQSTKIGKLKGSKLMVVIDYQMKMGQVDAAIVSTNILSRYEPKLLLMTGLCASRTTKGIKVGDIIVPREVFDYQTGKLDQGAFKSYAYRVKIDDDLISMAREWKQDLIRRVEDESARDKKRIRGTNVHFDVMACGSLVLKTDNSLDDIAETMDEKTVAVEMESYGIARSCDLPPYKNYTKAMIIKASMDGGDKSKNDDHREWAAYISINFAYQFVKRLENKGYFQ